MALLTLNMETHPILIKLIRIIQRHTPNGGSGTIWSLHTPPRLAGPLTTSDRPYQAAPWKCLRKHNAR